MIGHVLVMVDDDLDITIRSPRSAPWTRERRMIHQSKHQLVRRSKGIRVEREGQLVLQIVETHDVFWIDACGSKCSGVLWSKDIVGVFALYQRHEGGLVEVDV